MLSMFTYLRLPRDYFQTLEWKCEGLLENICVYSSGPWQSLVSCQLWPSFDIVVQELTLMTSKSGSRDILAKTAVSLSPFLRISITIIVVGWVALCSGVLVRSQCGARTGRGWPEEAPATNSPHQNQDLVLSHAKPFELDKAECWQEKCDTRASSYCYQANISLSDMLWTIRNTIGGRFPSL